MSKSNRPSVRQPKLARYGWERKRSGKVSFIKPGMYEDKVRVPSNAEAARLSAELASDLLDMTAGM